MNDRCEIVLYRIEMSEPSETSKPNHGKKRVMRLSRFQKQQIDVQFIEYDKYVFNIYGYIHDSLTGKKYKIHIYADEYRSHFYYQPHQFCLADTSYERVVIYKDNGKPMYNFGWGDKYTKNEIVYKGTENDEKYRYMADPEDAADSDDSDTPDYIRDYMPDYSGDSD